MRKISNFLFIPYLLWMVLFIIVPVILLVYFSFIDINGHFSFSNYKQILSMKYLSMILGLSDLCNCNHIIDVTR
jgi:spermidine/putrescine transport system permease protein